MIVSGNDQLVLNASETLYVNGLDLEGTYKVLNGKRQNAKVLFDAKNVIFKNVNIKGSIYNSLEQSGSAQYPIESLKVSNIVAKDTNIGHNIINAYKFADNAEVLIENGDFNLCVSNSNIARVSNIGNAKNVTVKFKNIEWTYENANKPEDDIKWGGVILVQPWPNTSDSAYKGSDLTAIKTWKFIFENCKYNGVKVTENMLGEISQLMVGYTLDSTSEANDVNSILNIQVL